MRIGILLPPLAGPAAGLRVYVEELVPRLLDRHPGCVLFTLDAEELPPWIGPAPVTRLSAGVAALARRIDRRAGRLVAIQVTLRRALRRGIDLLLVPFHDGLIASPVPQVVIVHDLTPLSADSRGRRLERLHLATVFRRVARRAEALIAVSASTRDDLARQWDLDPDLIEVVGEGIDPQLFHRFERQEIENARARYDLASPYLFYAGTLAPHKNLETALDTLALLRVDRPELTFVAAGPRAGDSALFDRQVAERDLSDAVRSLGYIDRRDLGPLMAGATAFVFPSNSEGFGLAVAEAMASGAVVLAADRASLPEVVGDGGLLLDPDDPRIWAQAVRDLLDEPHRARTLRDAAQRRSALFRWDATADRISAILSRLAERSAGR